jgi:hypothetical protein
MRSERDEVSAANGVLQAEKAEKRAKKAFFSRFACFVR